MTDAMDDGTTIQYPIDDRQTSYAVINGVSVISNNKPTAFPPLHDTIDTDALNALSSDLDEGFIGFDYAGYHVTVSSDDVVTISPD